MPITNAWSYTAGAGLTLVASPSPFTVSGVEAWIVAIAEETMTGACEIVVNFTDTDDNPGVCFYMARDSRTRYQVDINSAGEINLRLFTWGDEESITVLDTHNVVSGAEGYIVVRIVGNEILVTVGSTAYEDVEVSAGISPNTISNLNRWGVCSNIDGCRITSASLYPLTPSEAARSEILYIACGGRGYFCADPDGLTLVQIPGQIGDSVGRVGFAEWEGEMLIIGGGLANVHNPVTNVLSAWYDTEHTYNGGDFATLPGATEPTSAETTKGRGTTKCTIIEVHNNRVFMSGWSERPEVVFASESDNRNSFRLLNIEAGDASAYTINAGDVVTAMRSLPSNNLLIGGKTSMRLHLGDPLWGLPQTPLIADAGISGPYAVTKNDVGLAGMHSPAGLFSMPQDSMLPVNISSPVLTEGIQIEPNEVGSYYVSVVRESHKHRLHVYITPVSSGEAVHFIRIEDERSGSGGLTPGNLFPVQFLPQTGPTAAIYWRGQLLVGTRDGYVLFYDESADSTPEDDLSLTDTENIESWIGLTLAALASPIGDTIVTSLRAVLSDDSDEINCRVYGGATAESLYDLSSPNLLFESDLGPFHHAFIASVRSPAMFVFLYNDASAARSFGVEHIAGNFEVGTMLSHRNRLSPSEPPRPSGTPSAGSGSGSTPGTPGSGPGGGSGQPGGGYGGGGAFGEI